MSRMHSIKLRPAKESDIPFLLDLRIKAMGGHYAAMGMTPTPEHLEARVRAGFDVAQIVELEGRPVGLLKVQRPAREWHVMQIQMTPEVQGQGIGSDLLKALLEEARQAGVAVTLSVLKVNRARELYERLGFVITGDMGDDGYRMRAEPADRGTSPCA